MTEPTKSEIIRITRRYLERALKANEVGTITPFEDDYFAGEFQTDEWNSRFLALKDAVGSSEYDEWLKRAVTKLFADEGFDVSQDENKLNQACHYLLRAQVEEARIMAAKFRGDHPDAIVKDSAFMLSGQGLTSGDMGEPVSKVVERYLDAKKGKVWSHKTLLDNERVLGWFRTC